MAVSYPKRVVIENKGLTRLHQALMFATVIFLIFRLQAARPWQVKVPVSGEVNLWPELDKESIRARESQMMSKPLCTSPVDFDYWYDSEGNFAYENYTCMPLCDDGVSRRNCTSQVKSYKHMEALVLLIHAREVARETTLRGCFSSERRPPF